MTGLSKKELIRSAKELRGTISGLSKELDALLKPLKSLCNELEDAIERYNSANAAFEKKGSDKNATKLQRAKDSLTAAWGAYSEAYAAIDGKYQEIMLQYARLAEICEGISDKEAGKVSKERDGFIASYTSRIQKSRGNLLDVVPEFLIPAPAEEVATEAKALEESEVAEDTEVVMEEPVAEASRPSGNATVASVSIAPVTIDISTYVERAISATMNRLTAGMERKIAAYVESLVIPKPEIPAPVIAATPVAPVEATDGAVAEGLVTTAKANNELLTHLLEEETHVYEKLRGMIANVQGLVDGITEMSASYMALAEKQRDAVEVQKQINDMQRHTAREQQGVQVNQKMIAEEQIAVFADQTSLTEGQKALIDKQKSLAEGQKAMAETQKTVLETYATLEAAMKAVMQAQKEIIATQQAIITGNAKNQEAQRLILEKQAEINAAQKEALAASKQLLRDQKGVADKASGRTAKPKKPAASAEEVAADQPASDGADE